jgi:hypothetical protein
MERVLALQALSEFSDVEPVGGESATSLLCNPPSTQSSAGDGHSSCSFNNCRGSDEIDW